MEIMELPHYFYRMNEIRGPVAGTHDLTHGMVMSGGGNETAYHLNETWLVSNVETTLDGASFSTLTPMPLKIVGHCLVALDNGGEIFMAGGLSFKTDGPSKRTYIYRGRAGGRWRRQPNMPTARQSK